MYVRIKNLSEIFKVEIDSHIIPKSGIDIIHFPRLHADNRAALPVNTFIRIITSASEVLPSLNIPIAI